ncbi:hypothetical protein IJL65_05210 [bacterium]|nr:hypothetical protein [bacterium]
MVKNKTEIYGRFFSLFCKWKISLIQIQATQQVRKLSAILNTGKLPNDKKSLTHPSQILSIKFQSVHANNNVKSSVVKYFL